MDAYSGLFTELRRATTYARRRQRRGPLDAATQASMYAKLGALYHTLEGQPLYQALLLVNKARVDHAAGKPVAEAAAYVEAARRFMDQQLWLVSHDIVTMEEAAHLALVALDLAVEVYREHGLYEEAGAVALSAAHWLWQCGLIPPAADWFGLAGDCYAAALPAPVAPSSHEPGSSAATSLHPALLGAVEALDAAADLAVDVGDLEVASGAIDHQLRLCVSSGHAAILSPTILHSAVSLALVYLVQKLHGEARATLAALMHFLELRGFQGGGGLVDGETPPEPALTGSEVMAVVQAMPLLQWLQEECEVGTDLPTIEGLCEHLMGEVAGQGNRPLRLLLYIAEVYRQPAYCSVVLSGDRPADHL
eukprot:GGOE01044593.1.p1 GENE.GGOE01044593.1~~GGOE01044593.1.p1  ORF type:complete len:364 (-),score=95.33 GGOE01044593.1:201-1292(-)